MKDPFAQIFISLEGNVRTDGMAIDALGEKTPGQLLRNDAGEIAGDTNLLLMVPTFGQFAGGVEAV
jgi:hypothetical protein